MTRWQCQLFHQLAVLLLMPPALTMTTNSSVNYEIIDDTSWDSPPFLSGPISRDDIRRYFEVDHVPSEPSLPHTSRYEEMPIGELEISQRNQSPQAARQSDRINFFPPPEGISICELEKCICREDEVVCSGLASLRIDNSFQIVHQKTVRAVGCSSVSISSDSKFMKNFKTIIISDVGQLELEANALRYMNDENVVVFLGSISAATINEDAFGEEISELFFYNVRVSYINDDAFRNLNKLERLGLRALKIPNILQRFGAVNTAMFPVLTRLKDLRILNCSLHSLHRKFIQATNVQMVKIFETSLVTEVKEVLDIEADTVHMGFNCFNGTEDPGTFRLKILKEVLIVNSTLENNVLRLKFGREELRSITIQNSTLGIISQGRIVNFATKYFEISGSCLHLPQANAITGMTRTLNFSGNVFKGVESSAIDVQVTSNITIEFNMFEHPQPNMFTKLVFINGTAEIPANTSSADGKGRPDYSSTGRPDYSSTDVAFTGRPSYEETAWIGRHSISFKNNSFIDIEMGFLRFDSSVYKSIASEESSIERIYVKTECYCELVAEELLDWSQWDLKNSSLTASQYYQDAIELISSQVVCNKPGYRGVKILLSEAGTCDESSALTSVVTSTLVPAILVILSVITVVWVMRKLRSKNSNRNLRIVTGSNLEPRVVTVQMEQAEQLQVGSIPDLLYWLHEDRADRESIADTLDREQSDDEEDSQSVIIKNF